MTRRNVTTTFMVAAAGLLLFAGVALAREQQTRGDAIVPGATQPATTLDDNGVDATRSPELQASDDHGSGTGASAEASAEASASAGDDHGNGSDDSAQATASASDDHGNGVGGQNGQGTDDQPTPSASPSFDDKTPKASAGPTSSIEDGGGHGGNR